MGWVFKNTQSEIYSLEIADNKYEKIKEEIKKFESNKEKYKFNITWYSSIIKHYSKYSSDTTFRFTGSSFSIFGII